MFTMFLTMGLKPGCLDAYKEAHDNLWPEIAKSMSDNGVNMAIYHEDGRLCLFASAPSEEHWNRSRLEPALAKWDAIMCEYLESDGPGKIHFRKPARVFGFGDFK